MTPPRTLSLRQLLLENTNYIIPIYQRNYSWRETQIEQFLQDIWDKCKENANSFYYIGTLIVDERNNGFEIIDGQQRYTTVVLINAILNKVFSRLDSVNKSNLKFDARSEVENYIKQTYVVGYDEFKHPQESECQNIKLALKIIKTFLKKKENSDLEDLEQYINYFYENVKIIQVGVPEGTDINHYFEIMNTRGEQLEAHEILKAWLIKNCEEQNRNRFAQIWDACSQMEVRIQNCFNREDNYTLFGQDFSIIPTEGLITLTQETITKLEQEDKKKLLDILETYEIDKGFDQSKKTVSNEKYRSIIDFPNFLLIVLRTFLFDDSVSLDDKNLLKENGFGYMTNNIKVKPEQFLSFLLKCRVLFDNYIIKQEERDGKTDWYILSPKYNNEGSIYWVNTFTFGKDKNAESEIDNIDLLGLKDIIILQTMLQVSFPGNSFKNWLLEVLTWLTQQKSVEYEKYMEQLINITQNLYKKESKKNPFTYFNTERFVFNLLDYLLWKEYNNKQFNLNSEYNKYFENFRFRGGNSIEHLLPKSHKQEIDAEDKDTILNSFGNLCLISNSNNSKYSDYGFKAKKEQFLKQNSTESLKQTIMFSNEEWNVQEIKKHETKMIELLNRFIGNDKIKQI
jgi:uncharacterized protein with ParB-like and HNH nuclease domain